MADEINYKLTIPEIIRDLLQSVFGDQFRLYRVGDPIRVGQSELPAIFVTDTAIEVTQENTAQDKLTHSITIQVVFNKKDELGRPVEGNTLDTILDNYIYGRDPETGTYSTASIMGVLRTHYTLDEAQLITVNQDVSVRKALVIRTSSEEDTTAEAILEMEVEELQTVNTRT